MHEADSHGQFEAHGWSFLRSFIEKDEIESIRELFSNALSRPHASCMDRRGNDLVPLRWREPIVSAILGRAGRIETLTGSIGSQDLKWISGYLSMKGANTPALWWHQDWWCWDHEISFGRAAPQVALLCYLGDADERNGALRILPGSHRCRLPLHDRLPEPHGDSANFLPDDHPAMTNASDQVTMRVEAGDAVVLDYRLLHGTHANQSEIRRDAVLLSFSPNWSALPSEIKGHLISHPALPARGETPERDASSFHALLPEFSGEAKDLSINRLPPASWGRNGISV